MTENPWLVHLGHDSSAITIRIVSTISPSISPTTTRIVSASRAAIIPTSIIPIRRPLSRRLPRRQPRQTIPTARPLSLSLAPMQMLLKRILLLSFSLDQPPRPLQRALPNHTPISQQRKENRKRNRHPSNRPHIRHHHQPHHQKRGDRQREQKRGHACREPLDNFGVSTSLLRKTSEHRDPSEEQTFSSHVSVLKIRSG